MSDDDKSDNGQDSATDGGTDGGREPSGEEVVAKIREDGENQPDPAELSDEEIEEETAKRLDPDNRHPNTEVDNTSREFDASKGQFLDDDAAPPALDEEEVAEAEAAPDEDDESNDDEADEAADDGTDEERDEQ